MMMMMMIYIYSKVNLGEVDLRVHFSKATTPKDRGGCYSIFWNASLYPYLIEC